MEIERMNTSPAKEVAVLEYRISESEDAERSLVRSAIENNSQFDAQFGQMHPLRILLVEDSLVNLKIALWFLKKLGYRADVAFNGIEAIDALQRRSYDVILMDAEMPEMNGERATMEIRKSFPAEQQPHIIAMTANTMQNDRAKYLAAGMDDYITKPLRIDDLIQALLSCNPLGDMTETAQAAIAN